MRSRVTNNKFLPSRRTKIIGFPEGYRKTGLELEWGKKHKVPQYPDVRPLSRDRGSK